MSIQTIENTQQLHEHIMALIVIEPRFLSIYEQVGIPSLRHNIGGFEQLMRAMVGQQLSVAAAASIWQRLLDAALTNPQAIIKATDEDLRAQGLSKQKTRYIRSLVDHDIDFAALEIMLDEEAIEVLTAVTGIGRWTAEMFLMFHLLRPNVLPLDDVGLIKGISANYFAGEPVSRSDAREIARAWEPWRSVGTWYMWRSLDPIPVNY